MLLIVFRRCVSKWLWQFWAWYYAVLLIEWCGHWPRLRFVPMNSLNCSIPRGVYVNQSPVHSTHLFASSSCEASVLADSGYRLHCLTVLQRWKMDGNVKLILFNFFQHFILYLRIVIITKKFFEFNCHKNASKKFLPFALLFWISAPCECSCFDMDQLDVEQPVFVAMMMQSSVAIASTMLATTNSMRSMMYLMHLVKIVRKVYCIHCFSGQFFFDA